MFFGQISEPKIPSRNFNGNIWCEISIYDNGNDKIKLQKQLYIYILATSAFFGIK